MEQLQAEAEAVSRAHPAGSACRPSSVPWLLVRAGPEEGLL